MIASGTAPVRLEVIGFGSSNSGNNIVHSNVNYGNSGEIANNGQFMKVEISWFKLEPLKPSWSTNDSSKI